MTTPLEKDRNDFSSASTWDTHSNRYAQQAEAVTGEAARQLVDKAASLLPFSSEDSRVLDLGAGSGGVTTKLLTVYPQVQILATDVSSQMTKTLDQKGYPSVRTAVLDATESHPEAIPTGAFSHVLSTFMIQFTANPKAVLSEAHRALASGGVMGFGTWIEVAFNKPWEVACKRLQPDYVPQTAFDASAWLTLPEVDAALKDAGFVDVKSELVYIPWHFPGGGEQWMNWWFEAKNPGAMKMQSGWKGDPEEVKPELRKVLDEQFGGGFLFQMGIGITVARKP